MGQTSRAVWKVHASPTAVFGLAGDISLTQPLGEKIGEIYFSGSAQEVRDVLHSTAQDIVLPIRDSVRKVTGDSDSLPVAAAIVATYCDDYPRIFVIQPDTTCVEMMDGVAAIGSGRPFAEHSFAIFRRCIQPSLNLYQCSAICARIIGGAVESSGPSAMIGGETQIAFIWRDQASQTQTTRFEDEERRRVVRDAVEVWVNAEAAWIQNLNLPPSEPGAPAEPPEPGQPASLA